MNEDRRSAAALEVRGLDVYYGHSHTLQGVDLSLDAGIFSVVGRNGMGKTTLCKAIMGLVPVSGGSIRVRGEDITRRPPAHIARRGVGYVPQGRRLWRSLSVDEHLRLAGGMRSGAWTVERIYDTFPRLAERKDHGGGQLSGGEQQMLAISRALVTNPQLLIMDEPTEGLAPVIVAQVEEMLLRLGEDGDMAVLLIEQNIGVATAISRNVAIMVNGRINRIIDSARLAADRDMQQRLLGVGLHAELTPDIDAPVAGSEAKLKPQPIRANGPIRIYVSNPTPPTRWSQPVPIARIEAAARTLSTHVARLEDTVRRKREPVTAQASGLPVVLVAGTLDTKGTELRFIRDIIAANGLRVRLVDVSTSGRQAACDVSAQEIALNHGRGGSAVFGPDRGVAVTAMAEAFANWIKRQGNIAGVISAGGSGAASLVAPAMRTLPVGVPKLIISSVASGDVGPYVGPADITMMHSVTDVQGLNSISRAVLSNGANAIAGMVRARLDQRETRERTASAALPSVGITMFGVTTPAVQKIAADLRDDFECLVFHATGVGGRSMEKLVDSGQLAGVIDLTTTEICDFLMGGVFPATEDRFGATIRTRVPYIGSVGALDMVNFGAPDTIPERYRTRKFHVHNPQVTLMRTTAEENERMGRWIGERLNRMDGPVRFFLPEGGVSALDVRGQPFWDPEADAALFRALERTVRTTGNRQLIRVKQNINDPEFATTITAAFRTLFGRVGARRRMVR
ncbi:ABC transporter permease [Bradyrhizobium sp. LTSP857]|uniref:ABC transporter permease n=1 Tax=Bradyrhizobium sp. LTSP857 TaxID=1619231 RepID=UPI0005D1B48F|nr:ABC transporter permease [Bradyrhizobium sp. LTSP857]KJC52405.1 ABC transporter permease [Bradyrhizobium sp. LTSP857]